MILLFFFNDTATTEIYTLSLHDALPIFVVIDCQRAGPSTGVPTKTEQGDLWQMLGAAFGDYPRAIAAPLDIADCFKLRSEEHTSELQSRLHLVCRLLLEKKITSTTTITR